MTRIQQTRTILLLLAALGWGGCASRPVREYEENTQRVISEQPRTGR
jgi:hypothetical protein